MQFSTSVTIVAMLSSQSAHAFHVRAPAIDRRHSHTATARFMAEPSMPFDDDEMPFYALGANLALQVDGVEKLLEGSEVDVLLKGFSDTLKGESSADEIRAVLDQFGPSLNKILQERGSKVIDTIKKEGADFVQSFLDCNEDAIRTDSGLVYCAMTEGEGATPSPTSTVEVHYHGTLTDGTVFDSSVDRGDTISFPVNGVIQAWQEGLQLMKEGGKATLLCPSDIAYGDQGSPPTISPGATLKFEVELIKVSESPAQDTPPPIKIDIDEILKQQQAKEE